MILDAQDRSSPFYRGEIDGLRAIAVLAVMAYHARFGVAAGGYIGVDVFFVISGYLITGIILREKATGRFSLLTFYERRIRRILPALFVVLIACLPPALLLFNPIWLESFGKSLAASSVFGANIYFWRASTDYFAAGAEREALLHLWSLSVEEQFYLFYPLVLMLIWRWGRTRLLWIMVAGLAASLALSTALSALKPAANFFLLPTRAWELLAGAIFALPEVRAIHIPRFLRRGADWVALAGLVLVIAPIFVYDADTPFPGLFALPPVVGTLLLLGFATPDRLVGRLLAAPPLVALGLMSYSAYLWHQPLLAFTRRYFLAPLGVLLSASILILSFGLAYWTWRLIERPFRRRSFLSRMTILAGAVLFSAALLGTGLLLGSTEGLPQRFSGPTLELWTATRRATENLVRCMLDQTLPEPASSACILGREGPVTVAVIGDSHAGAIAPALEPELRRRRERAILLAAGGCRYFSESLPSSVQVSECADFNRAVSAYLRANHNIRTVVIGGHWSFDLERTHFNNGEGGVGSGARLPALSASERSMLISEYRGTVRQLVASGRRVILVYPVPEAGWDVPIYLMQRRILRDPHLGSLTTSYQAFIARNRTAYAALNSIGAMPGLRRVYPEQGLCNPQSGRCMLEHGGDLLYFDDNHLTAAGARAALPDIGSVID